MNVNIALLTVTDTRTLDTDKSGNILEKKVKIIKNETPKSLAKKILIQEHKLYPKAIRKVFNL